MRRRGLRRDRGAEPVKVAHAVRARAQREPAGRALRIGRVVHVDDGALERGVRRQRKEVRVARTPPVRHGGRGSAGAGRAGRGGART